MSIGLVNKLRIPGCVGDGPARTNGIFLADGVGWSRLVENSESEKQVDRDSF